MCKTEIKNPAKDIIERFGQTQRNSKTCFPCPRCGCNNMCEDLTMNALSRIADVYICSGGGTEEALSDYFGYEDNLDDWSLVVSLRG